MSGHGVGATPGPWQLIPGHQRHDGSVRGWKVVFPDKGYEVAQVNNFGREDNEANARLIAAAPALLAALQAAVACRMVPVSSAKDGGASALSEQVRVADQIRDAIALASRGGPQL